MMNSLKNYCLHCGNSHGTKLPSSNAIQGFLRKLVLQLQKKKSIKFILIGQRIPDYVKLVKKFNGDNISIHAIHA